MSKIKVAFFDIKQLEKDYLESNKPDNCKFTYIEDTFHHGIDSNIKNIEDIDILSVFTSSRVTGEKLEYFKNLKLITTRSTGYNNVDQEYCQKAGIKITNVPRYGECTVAEYTFALLLNVIRKVSQAYNELKNGKINLEGLIGMDLQGKSIGIIGTGAIGCYTAKIAHGFGMKILTYDPFPKEDLRKELGVEYMELDDLLKKSDIISLHAPSTKENFHMINEEAFNKMKDGVIIINTARGEIMDTNALYRALKNGKVAGAGLDVVECEEILAKEELFLMKIDCVQKDCLAKTLINHKLLEMPNVVVTPHIAFDSVEAMQRILNTTIKNIESFASKDLINVVN